MNQPDAPERALAQYFLQRWARNLVIERELFELVEFPHELDHHLGILFLGNFKGRFHCYFGLGFLAPHPRQHNQSALPSSLLAGAPAPNRWSALRLLHAGSARGNLTLSGGGWYQPRGDVAN